MRIKRGLPIIYASLFSLCSCYSQSVTNSRFAFDTVVSYSLYDSTTKLADEVIKTIDRYNKLFDSYKEYKNIVNINSINKTNEEIQIDSDLYNALKVAFDYKSSSEGYFNPLIGNLSNAWKNALENGQILSNTDISSYIEEMNSSSLEFDDGNLSVRRVGNASIDLGAFAKGYTLSILQKMFYENNSNGYLVDAGSSSIILGTKSKDKSFSVGIKYLDNAHLNLKNTAIGTSAIYEQLTEIEGVKYSHIVNPFTGSTIPNYDFVLVINENCTLDDVLSTSFMSMDLDTIKEFESRHDLKVIVSSNHEVIYKSNTLEL